jgi:hypothetical protein
MMDRGEEMHEAALVGRGAPAEARGGASSRSRTRAGQGGSAPPTGESIDSGGEGLGEEEGDETE